MSPKVYAHLYIDDCGLGIPRKPCPDTHLGWVVDWYTVGPLMCTRIREWEKTHNPILNAGRYT